MAPEPEAPSQEEPAREPEESEEPSSETPAEPLPSDPPMETPAQISAVIEPEAPPTAPTSAPAPLDALAREIQVPEGSDADSVELEPDSVSVGREDVVREPLWDDQVQYPETASEQEIPEPLAAGVWVTAGALGIGGLGALWGILRRYRREEE